jgi:hypothetical protein
VGPHETTEWLQKINRFDDGQDTPRGFLHLRVVSNPWGQVKKIEKHLQCRPARRQVCSPLLFTEEFELGIMIAFATEEMRGSDRVSWPEKITRRAVIGWDGIFSTRAKRRFLKSGC